ncbi:hypothetical protein HMPREF0293_1848 [Corynebacterium glucuronolyticum ATCC 51866]|uniref:Uncharacterized protein n=1 Tax=Corynebacterium glucuronolyticum ATCC 51866 TaxID=548478 RepID=A0ABM9XNI9_9CORY|nr:hypothetical protein HMPREF0293_1848 [Corynebacterium glucuronolyticum ATCC 51866]
MKGQRKVTVPARGETVRTTHDALRANADVRRQHASTVQPAGGEPSDFTVRCLAM